MKKTALYLWLSLAFFTAACSIDNQDDIDDIGNITTEAFTEGIVEMGMYSHGIDIGHYIKHIDFSRDDTKEQLEALIAEAGPENNLLSHFQRLSETNPLAGLMLMFNTVISDYHIKGEAVLGKSRGFGFIYDHFHDKQQDVGKIFMKTMVSSEAIPEADRQLYAEYAPSEQGAASPNTSFDADLFDRQVLDEKENILGYACNVSVYTLKAAYGTPDPDNPLSFPMIQKLVVYTSPLFSETINFTHPFYMPEDGGILRVDIFLDSSDQATLEMRPYKIIPQDISEAQLRVETADPVYQMTDISWGFKALGIFMSGWGTFGE
jgi:hypothetical protein